MINRKMSLYKRFFIYLLPAVILIGLTNIIHTWLGYQETTFSYYKKSMEKNIRDLTILSRMEIFQYYFEDRKKGYLANMENDLNDIRIIFSQAMSSLSGFDETALQIVLYDSDWNIIIDIQNELPDKERILTREEPFISVYQDFSKPYSTLVEDHHVMVFPIFSNVIDTGYQSKAVLGFIHSEVRLPLDKLKKEAFSKLVFQIEWIFVEVIFFIFLIFLVGRSVAKPLMQFCDNVEKISNSGFNEHFRNETNIAELEVLERTLNHMRDNILSRQQQLLILLCHIH
ncbi:MAG: hypothetical protein HQL78_11890 [Magnetococcales bacterium]|nr:hypothetical protein [Magnetococcales bacterium]